MLRKKYHDARHHCFAWMLGVENNKFRANDDGEPSNTAGTPILGQIRSFELTNILIIVIRYFGGVKLGVSGLINAYKTAATEALKNAKIIEKKIEINYSIKFKYNMLNDMMQIIKQNNLRIIKQEFDNDCEIIFAVPKTKNNYIIELFNSKYNFICFVKI
jgi:uncharacterized YigZ family protein